MGIVAALTAVYFCLMCLYSTACTCLTGDESNQKPSFSVCGCFSILLAIGSYFWGWVLFLTVSNEASQVIMDNYPLIWNAFCVLLFNPVATVSMVLLFFIYRSCCKRNDIFRNKEWKYQHIEGWKPEKTNTQS